MSPLVLHLLSSPRPAHSCTLHFSHPRTMIASPSMLLLPAYLSLIISYFCKQRALSYQWRVTSRLPSLFKVPPSIFPPSFGPSIHKRINFRSPLFHVREYSTSQNPQNPPPDSPNSKPSQNPENSPTPQVIQDTKRPPHPSERRKPLNKAESSEAPPSTSESARNEKSTDKILKLKYDGAEWIVNQFTYNFFDAKIDKKQAYCYIHENGRKFFILPTADDQYYVFDDSATAAKNGNVFAAILYLDDLHTRKRENSMEERKSDHMRHREYIQQREHMRRMQRASLYSAMDEYSTVSNHQHHHYPSQEMSDEDAKKMFKAIIGAAVLLAFSMIMFLPRRSDTVIFSGRRRMMPVPNDWEQTPKIKEYFEKKYSEELTKIQVFSDEDMPVFKDVFKMVMTKLILGTPELRQFRWSIKLVNAFEPNAAATPRNLFFNIGMIMLLENEDELATVVAHEMAHVLARHIAELYGSAIDNHVQGKQAYVSVSSYQSQQQEIEADIVGLILMARACYDPSKAPLVWKKIDAWQKTYVVEEKKAVSFFDIFGGSEGKFESHPTNDIRFEKMSGEVSRASAEGWKVGCHHKDMRCNAPETTQHFWDLVANMRTAVNKTIAEQVAQKKAEELASRSKPSTKAGRIR